LSSSYTCRKCGNQHAEKEYRQSNFCHQCGTFISGPDEKPQGTTPANVFLDVERAENIGKILHNDFQKRIGYFTGYIMPEYSYPKNIVQGSREQALYFTYVISVDKQTNAVKLWQNAGRIFENHPEYFDPKFIVNADQNFLSSLLKNLGARYANKGAQTWKTISELLLKRYEGDPRNITRTPLAVKEIKSLIQAFPELKGKKLSNLYLRVMGENRLFKITDLKDLDIPVDIQVARFTIFTGCLNLKSGTLSGCVNEPPIQPGIEQVWRNAAKNLGIGPWQIDEPMWTIGSNLCSNHNCQPCPAKEYCLKNFDASISSNMLYWKR
jgi:hypothetical protein